MALEVIGSTPIIYQINFILKNYKYETFLNKNKFFLKLFFFNLNKNYISLNVFFLKKYFLFFNFLIFFQKTNVIIFFEKRLNNYKFFLEKKILIITLNLCKQHPKINLYDNFLKKNLNWSVGVLLKYLNISEKNIRRSFKGLKILINFILKKINKNFNNYNIILKIKGLKKNIVKIFNLFDLIFNNFKLNFFFISIFKNWDKKKIKILRFIKRRIRKKLIKIDNKR